MRSVSTLASLHRLPPWHCWPWWCWMLRVPWASRASGAKLVLKLERQWFAKKDKFGSLMYMYLDYIVCGCLLWFWTTLVGSCSYGFGLRLEPWLQDAQRQPGCWLISIQFSGEPQLWRKILGGEVNHIWVQLGPFFTGCARQLLDGGWCVDLDDCCEQHCLETQPFRPFRPFVASESWVECWEDPCHCGVWTV